MLPGRMLRSLALLLLIIPFASQARAADWRLAVTVAYRLQADGSYEARETREVAAADDAGARVAAQQSYGWSEGLEAVDLLEAYTLKADGTRRPLAPDGIVPQATAASPVFPSYSDWQARSLVFAGVGPGDVVHYVLRRRSRTALMPGAWATALGFGDAAHIAAVDLSVEVPPAMTLGATANGLQEAESPAVPGGGERRRWRLAPGASGLVAVDLSTFADYPALGDAYAARALPQAAPDASVRALAGRLTAGLPTPAARARRLYAFVAREIRYVGLELGLGRVVPRAAAEVLRDGYGDCKDHVALLGALLAAAGVEAVPALIGTSPRYELPTTPTLAAFDHVILYLPALDTWLDATSPYAPFGVLPFAEYGKPVLLTGPGGARLAHIPDLPPGLAWTRVRTTLEAGADGALRGRTETEAGGPFAIALRGAAAALDEGEESEQLRRIGTPGQGRYEYAPPLEVEAEAYRVAGTFRLDDTLSDAPDGRLVPPAGLTLLARPGSFLVAEGRDAAGHQCYAGRQEEEITLRLPAGLDAALPADVAVRAGHASYAAAWRREGGNVTVRRRFEVDAPHPLCSERDYQAMLPALRAARRELHAELALRDAAPPAAAATRPSPPPASPLPVRSGLAPARPPLRPGAVPAAELLAARAILL